MTMAQCTAHAQLKSVYGVSRGTCRLEPDPPISMSKVRGPGVKSSICSLSSWRRPLHVKTKCATGALRVMEQSAMGCQMRQKATYLFSFPIRELLNRKRKICLIIKAIKRQWTTTVKHIKVT